MKQNTKCVAAVDFHYRKSSEVLILCCFKYFCDSPLKTKSIDLFQDYLSKLMSTDKQAGAELCQAQV